MVSCLENVFVLVVVCTVNVIVKEPADENKCVGWAKLEKLF
jgi:hypothetical protein